jgi:hypothetical protein
VPFPCPFCIIKSNLKFDIHIDKLLGINHMGTYKGDFLKKEGDVGEGEFCSV